MSSLLNLMKHGISINIMHDALDLHDRLQVEPKRATTLPADLEAVGKYPLVDVAIKRLHTEKLKLELRIHSTDSHEKRQRLHDEMAEIGEKVDFLRRLSESHRGWGDMRGPGEIAFSQEAISRVIRDNPELAQLVPEYRIVYVYAGANRTDIDTLNTGVGYVENLGYKDAAFLQGKSEAMRSKYEPVSVLTALRIPVELSQNVPEDLAMAA